MPKWGEGTKDKGECASLCSYKGETDKMEVKKKIEWRGTRTNDKHNGTCGNVIHSVLMLIFSKGMFYCNAKL